MSRKTDSMLMTEGPIARQLIAFAAPLLLGNLCQQLYNTADSLIVGNFLGSTALAAVSSSANLIYLMIGFFNGIAMGAGVVIARHYGARSIERLQKAIHTLLVFGVFCGLGLTAVGVGFSPAILRLMGTPENVLPQSVTYFSIYFAGSLAFVFLNLCMGILQAVGDSRHPLEYLVISSVINIILDLVLVGVFRFGVGAAAAATVTSQIISCVLCLHRLMNADPDYRVDFKKLGINKRSLIEILQNGIPAGVTNSIIAISNVVIQSNINAFGAAAMAGCGSHSRIEGFAFMPVMCFNTAITTFVSQNIGANRIDRVKKGVKIGIGMDLAIAQTIAVLVFIFSPKLIGMFDRSPDVIAFGVMHERTTAPFFFLVAYTHAMSAVMRGAGKSTVPMLVMLLCWCLVRVVYVTIAVQIRPILSTISWAYPITWTLSSLVFTFYYLRGTWLGSAQEN